MEAYADDPNELANVPTGMENDPNADEEIINQQAGETVPSGTVQSDTNPSGVEKPTPQQATPLDDLANSIAFAIDGSGPGPNNTPPVAPSVGSTQSVISEGTTGAGEEQEREEA